MNCKSLAASNVSSRHQRPKNIVIQPKAELHFLYDRANLVFSADPMHFHASELEASGKHVQPRKYKPKTKPTLKET